MAKIDEPSQIPDDVSPDTDAAVHVAVAPEIVATSFPEYIRISLSRIRAGETGIWPVVAGLLLVSVLFQVLNDNFLTAGNLVNLLVQASVFSVLAMGEVFALLLGEIDLSIGYVSGLAGVVMGELIAASVGWPWWAGIAAALVMCAGIGLLQGSIITRIGLPSFIVTLAGLLFWEGVMLKILGNGGSILINVTMINNIASANLQPIVGWVLMLAIVGVFGVIAWRRDARRRAAGLVAPPPSVTLAKIVAGLIGGVVIVTICNINRGRILPIRGVPWVVLVVLGVLGLWTFILGRTKFGRYVYAIGGNAEAARRAGVNLARVRTICFMLCSITAGIGGVIYASRLRSISTAIDGGTLVLYAVAAAVIGGTSLFGGRGKPLHGVLGGIVIAAIENGMGLIGIGAPAKFMITALVLLVAVTIDALGRRGRVTGR